MQKSGGKKAAGSTCSEGKQWLWDEQGNDLGVRNKVWVNGAVWNNEMIMASSTKEGNLL